ncbi:glycerophosphodiester phosphodiesterase family protein [Kitasatospora sp. NBC_01250]|uniref:glycerophosphodiester phosphodiesterase family protein n=1 Tax=Kitasatospora sp. NBC_01250 TaxID=2903571 RepID=UPI002E35EE3E|nr:glycerophosphodiester phosphodiesterase family protein [Kitasatospora sp. NBC_01250]
MHPQPDRWADRSRRPLVIAHRAGGGDLPENTLEAVRAAVAAPADLVWLSVQVSSDGVPVLYRPAELHALTDGCGRVGEHTAAELTALNAGHAFVAADGSRPYRAPHRKARLPTLAAALAAVPAQTPLILDLKSPQPVRLVRAITRLLDDRTRRGTRGWERIRFYSTEPSALRVVRRAHPRSMTFEDRDTTRGRLLAARLTGNCPPSPVPGRWVGFELRRDLVVAEDCMLGRACGTVHDAVLWDRRTVDCCHRVAGVAVVVFGVDNASDYREAARLGADAVLTDHPAALLAVTGRRASAPFAAEQSVGASSGSDGPSGGRTPLRRVPADEDDGRAAPCAVDGPTAGALARRTRRAPALCGPGEFTDRILSAMRGEFGGHAEKQTP